MPKSYASGLKRSPTSAILHREKIEEWTMFRAIGLASAALLTAFAASAEQASFLLCEYTSLGEDQRMRSQSIPLLYKNDRLVAIGQRHHCVDEPAYVIMDTHAAWRCVTAFDADQAPVRSVYVEIHRYTGRYHRNDFDGHYDDRNIREIYHGVCTPHHEAQF